MRKFLLAIAVLCFFFETSASQITRKFKSTCERLNIIQRKLKVMNVMQRVIKGRFCDHFCLVHNFCITPRIMGSVLLIFFQIK